MEKAVGSREAVERVVRDHSGWVFAAARRRVGDAALAEDVTQAVFLLYWRKGVRFEGEGKLAGWLYRAVRYCSANAVRLRRIRQQHEREAAVKRMKDGEAAAGWSEVEVELEGAVDRLSEKDRQAVVLRFYRNLSLREVGEAMGLSEDGARKRVKVAAIAVASMAVMGGVIAIDATAGPTNGALTTTQAVHSGGAKMPMSGGADALPAQFVVVAEHIDQARAKITSISYTAIDEGDEVFGEMGKRHVRSEWSILEKGSLRAARRQTVDDFADGRTPSEKSQTCAVLGETFFAYQWNGNSVVDQYSFDAPGVYDRQVRSRIRMFAGVSILAYGFGDGDLAFDAPYLRDPAKSRWEIRELRPSAGRTVYELSRYALNNPAGTHPESIWVVDPQCGGLIASLKRYDENGALYRDLQTDCKEVAPGIFMPVRVRDIRYWTGPAGTSAPASAVIHDKVISSRTIEFKDIVINPDIPKERFTLAYMDLPKGSRILQRSPSGAAKLGVPASKGER